MDSGKNHKKQNYIGFAVSIVAFMVAAIGVRQLFFRSPYIDTVIAAAADTLNKTCPMMVDDITPLDSATALPGRTFQYNYTLVSMTREQVDTVAAKKVLAPAILSNIKTNPDMKTFRDNKVTIIYSYKDKAGNYILSIAATPADYAGG